MIVAAGIGSRLQGPEAGPKPLQPVVGVPLVARVMRAAARAGIRRFVVVVGHQAEAMRQGLPACLPAGCVLEVVENPRYREPNGVSLRAALDVVAEPFALLMADHLFTPQRLARARERFVETGRALLVVQRRETFDGDVDDATRVATQDGRVVGIDKHLEAWDAVDTGMFVLEPGALRAALDDAGPAPSISDGMRRLAADGRLDAFVVEAGRWQDVDTPEDLRRAEDFLFASLVKPEDGFLARHVNRRVSLFVTRRLWGLGITPNAMTLATLGLGLAAGWAFSRGAGVAWGLLGAALFQLQSILDGVDGELARLLHKESRFGFWLDVTCDNLTHMAVFGGIAVGQAGSGVPGPWGLLGTLAVLGVAADFVVMAPLIARPAKGVGRGSRHPLLQRMVDGLARRDFTWLLFPLAVLGGLGWFLWAAAVGTWIYAAVVLVLRGSRRA